MGADNWTLCPRCQSVDEVDKLKKKLEDSYGKIPAKEYLKLVSDLDKLKDKRRELPSESVAEYYELGITKEGKFYISYSAECRNEGCGFKHNFKHEEKL